MKHPSNEDWMDFLYGEVTLEQRQAWGRHRDQCSDCRQKLARWAQTREQLSHWQDDKVSFAAAKHPSTHSGSGILWKAAAVLLIGISFFLGHRSGSRSIDKQALLTELSSQIRAEIQSTLQSHPTLVNLEAQERPQEWNQIREELQEIIQMQTIQSAAAITQLRQETSAVMDRFHTQLETVALVAEGRYQRSQNQLSSLAAIPRYQSTPITVQHNLNR